MENILRSAFFSSRDQQAALCTSKDNVTATGSGAQGKPDAGNGTPSQRKRKRTLYSKWQQVELESVFEVIPYPDISTREHLAKIIRLPESKVQVWFQNRRARKNKSGKLDKSLYRRGSTCHPAHLFLRAASPSHCYNQRDRLITMSLPTNQPMTHGHNDQQITAMQQAGHSAFYQASPPISQQYLGEETYQCAYWHQDPQWQNVTSSTISATSPEYGCQATWYDTQLNDLEQVIMPSHGPYWELFPHTMSEKGSQTSLGYISDVIYNAALLTNLGDV
ncbi:homeobox protein SEBOX [Pseudophryne corroboree]|uniref:homeobox protein SEBOX n=1 Tax=Pseudophryne corroboree TaxID=495146 RepID=UPI003081C61E